MYVFLLQDLEGVEEFIREYHDMLVAIGEVCVDNKCNHTTRATHTLAMYL